MLDRFVAWLYGDDDAEAYGFVLAVTGGIALGVMLGTLKQTNRLMADISSHLDEQRRLSIAAAQRDFAAKEQPNA